MEMVGSEPEVVHATLHSALFVHSRGTQRGAAIPLAGACGAYHDYQLDWLRIPSRSASTAMLICGCATISPAGVAPGRSTRRST